MNLVDRLICELDTGLRTVFAKVHADRRMPRSTRTTESNPATLEPVAREESIRLMRVNHCGEVCAQALYQGQALVAEDETVQRLLLTAANEEHDHLAWCDARLTELGGRSSYLSPAFYAGSFALGVVSGLLGDRWSMGFLVETERQVEAHLRDHLGRISFADADSRAILEAMRNDEIRHGQTGLEHGAEPLPRPVKMAMRGISKVMTGTTYWV
ncbi:MAG: 2-polyprenyl-3-methyl-6-methoxy-1,4-benzoquinone monooxygenase [Betaproteobacteria bacterium]|nr:2-polyprenyl-3-methyl-6-methoxy-1,4-benzoquinone monooxygenase [Betaproteobacteria bacterium]